MIEEKLFIPNRFGEKLEVLLRKPDSSGIYPAALFVHGFDMDFHEWKNSFDEIATLLVEKGYITLQFSFAGCGKSEGKHADMTLERQAAQVEDMTAYLRTRQDVDKAHISLIAQSFGVPTTLMTDLTGVHKYIFISGVFTSFIAGMEKKCAAGGEVIHYDGITKIPRSHKVTLVGPDFWPSIHSFSASDRLKLLHASVLFIHGDQDEKVSTEEVHTAYANTASNDKKLEIFTGGDHGICDVPADMRKHLLTSISDWLIV